MEPHGSQLAASGDQDLKNLLKALPKPMTSLTLMSTRFLLDGSWKMELSFSLMRSKTTGRCEQDALRHPMFSRGPFSNEGLHGLACRS